MQGKVAGEKGNLKKGGGVCLEGNNWNERYLVGPEINEHKGERRGEGVLEAESVKGSQKAVKTQG